MGGDQNPYTRRAAIRSRDVHNALHAVISGDSKNGREPRKGSLQIIQLPIFRFAFIREIAALISKNQQRARLARRAACRRCRRNSARAWLSSVWSEATEAKLKIFLSPVANALERF